MNIIDITTKFAKQEYAKHEPIHQWTHIQEVMEQALKIAKLFNEVDLEILKLAVILHDVTYHKYETHVDDSMKTAKDFLAKQNYPADKTKKVCDVMIAHSGPHRKKLGNTKLIEGKIIFDAERITRMKSKELFEKYYPKLYLEEAKDIANQIKF